MRVFIFILFIFHAAATILYVQGGFFSFKFIAITKRQNKHNKAIIIVLYEDDEVQKILREGIF